MVKNYVNTNINYTDQCPTYLKSLQQKFNFPLVVEVKCCQQEDYIAVATSLLLYVLCMEFIEWVHNGAIMSASISIHISYHIHLSVLKLNMGFRIWTKTYQNFAFVLIHSIQSLLYVKLKFKLLKKINSSSWNRNLVNILSFHLKHFSIWCQINVIRELYLCPYAVQYLFWCVTLSSCTIYNSMLCSIYTTYSYLLS
jgi:hypothetical protein